MGLGKSLLRFLLSGGTEILDPSTAAN